MAVKFLIIRFSSIGDIVLTTPVVRCLKEQVEGAEIHYVVKKQFVSVLSGNPYIDKIHAFDGDLKSLVTELEKEDFNYIIDLHHNLRSFILKRKLKLISFSFNKINLEKALITSPLKFNLLPKLHIVDRYLETTSVFDISNDNQGLDFYILPENEIEFNELPTEFQKGFIAFVIGAKHTTKKLPFNKIIDLCNLIKYPIVLLGGKEDTSYGDLILQNVQGKQILNACGKYNLQQSASLVKHSELVISHDTGLMHIAAALKKPIFSIWGNTIPGFGMFPYNSDKNSKIFEITSLKCRPCSKIGYKKCPRGHFRCMNLIDINSISEAANAFLKIKI